MEELTIIICSFNEEKTICDVVRACRLYNEGSEIIVVDDGSLDNTEALLRKLNQTIRFSYIRLPENKGKSYAMTVGIEKLPLRPLREKGYSGKPTSCPYWMKSGIPGLEWKPTSISISIPMAKESCTCTWRD